METESGKQDMFSHERLAIIFLIDLALIAGVATFFIIYLLNYNQLEPGNYVILAGLGGIIGASLSPLLQQQSKQRFDGSPYHLVVRIFIYVAGGFGFAAAAFIMTTALLMDTPGVSASQLGTVAFSGIVGFLIGREINRLYYQRKDDGLGSVPAVISALDNLEDQLFGRPLYNYDGFVITKWERSDSSSAAIGRLLVSMVPRSIREREKYKENRMKSSSDQSESTFTEQGRVLIQGGKDAEIVPFALSIISGKFEVYPSRLILTAPSEKESEVVVFTLVEVASESGETILASELTDNIAGTRRAGVLLDVSQAGRTVHLQEVEILY